DHRGRLHRVAGPRMITAPAEAELVTIAEARAVADGGDAADADALVSPAAALADAAEAEPAGAARLVARGAPPVPRLALPVVALHHVTPPHHGRGVAVARDARVDQPDHPEVGRVAERLRLREVDIRVVLRPRDARAAVGPRGRRAALRAAVALRRR